MKTKQLSIHEETPARPRLRDNDLLLFGNPVDHPCMRHVSDIISLDSSERFITRVTFLDRTALVRKPLKECAARLNPMRFFQANRACIVNLAHVERIRTLGPKACILILSNEREVMLSRRRAVQLREMGAL